MEGRLGLGRRLALWEYQDGMPCGGHALAWCQRPGLGTVSWAGEQLTSGMVWGVAPMLAGLVELLIEVSCSEVQTDDAWDDEEFSSGVFNKEPPSAELLCTLA